MEIIIIYHHADHFLKSYKQNILLNIIPIRIKLFYTFAGKQNFMLNILIVYAVEEERVLLEMPNCKFHYCRTGVGKIAAALAVEKAISNHHPDAVINIGTAGTVRYEIGSIHLCKKFIDRDMEKLQNFGIPFQEDFSEDVEKCTFFTDWYFDSICNTGDTFLTSADGTGDIFDMESFAVARVCRSHQIPFVGVKCVTDIIGQNSIKHWEEKLSEAQNILQNFVNNNIIKAPTNYIGKQAQEIVDHLQLQKHPEGGYFKEVYRSSLTLKKEAFYGTFPDERSALTSIYYLLANDQFSAFHRIKSPETWYFHKGMPLIIHMILENGEYKKVELSDKIQGRLQYTVEPNTWFAAEIKECYGFSLVSCAVAPGFDFADFEMAEQDQLISSYPHHHQIINRLSITKK